MAGLRVSSRQNGVVSRAYSPPSSAEIGGESLEIAESATRDVLSRVWPTLVADKKRCDIIDYLQSLVRYFTGCEIFTYGSVPLKTYLPDGDIDLTAISPDIADTALASDIYAVLRREEHNEAARFKVKDVHRIDAEVKLVKCIIENIVVDISFNQLGGLSALCFLEQIDRHIGNGHLFKRSIILIKAWCYYESRILGAHHGLISTYALEILVLHIFDAFHSSLEGPLSVLYTFLVYFSGFDWDNHCISLKGPVGKSFHKGVFADIPVNETGGRLLSEGFLKSCRENFSISSNGVKTKSQPFPLKHLNIIDPLKENNNLGRSVSRGSFCRIRSAFKYGASKLGRILSLPTERISDELHKFFSNTLDRNIVSDCTQTCGPRVSESLLFPSPSETFSKLRDIVDMMGSFKIGGPEISSASQEIYSHFALQLRCHLSEEDDARFENGNRKTVNSGSYSTMNGETKLEEKHAALTNTEFIDPMALIDLSNVSKIIDNLEQNIPGLCGDAEALTLLLDLGGDYDSHFRNLRCGQLCHFHATSPTLFPVFLPSHRPTHFSVVDPRSCTRNGFGLGPQCYRTENFVEENRKSRGTGTYLPNSNFRPYIDMRSGGRRRATERRTSEQFPRHHRDRGDNWSWAPPEELQKWHNNSELSQAEYFGLSDWDSGSSDHYYQANYPLEGWDSFQENVCSFPPEKLVDKSPTPPSPETDLGASPSIPVASEKCKPYPAIVIEERVEGQSYHLKDECDFPPLTA